MGEESILYLTPELWTWGPAPHLLCLDGSSQAAGCQVRSAQAVCAGSKWICGKDKILLGR